jgi:hypothetical protein
MSKNKLITTERVLTSALALSIGAAVVDSMKSPAGLNSTNEGVKDTGVKIDVKPVDANHLVSSKTGELHKVSYTFEYGQGMDDMRLNKHLKGDRTQVDDALATYLPADEQQLKNPQVGDTLTVSVDGHDHVVPNPNPEDSAPGS